MATPAIAALYVGLSGVLLLALSLNVVRIRVRHRVVFGDGGHAELARAIRVQGNFVEYAPLTLLAIALLSLMGFDAGVIHGLGLALVAGRVLHAWGLSRSPGESFGRGAGMGLTWLALLAASLLCIYGWLEEPLRLTRLF